MRLILLAYVFLSFTARALAEPMPPTIERRLDAVLAASKAGAMVVAVIDGDRTYVAGTNANAQSLIRINSLTKLMTGEVLANLVAEGRVHLDDPLQSYAPAGRKVPLMKGARAITLRDLAAHLSGLPRDMPTGLSRDARWAWLTHVRLARAPGTVAEYSNTAYMFLGDALSRAAGESYDALVKRYITTPLALNDTTLTPTEGQCARLLPTAHPCAPTYAIQSMGGLYSTADDMARWMRAEIDAARPSPRATAQDAIVARPNLERVVNLDMAGPMDAIAMGWLRMRLGTTQVLQKTGGGGGFMNYVILAPAERKGLFITVNRVDIEMLRRLTGQANDLMREELLARQ